jgi:hypothetical protein
MQNLTGNAKFGVPISRIGSLGFDSNIYYDFKVNFRLHSKKKISLAIVRLDCKSPCTNL